MSYPRRYRNAPPRPGRWMDLKYAGKCAGCDKRLPVGTRAFYDPADKLVCCTEIVCAEKFGLTKEEWNGSPTKGSWVTSLSPMRIGGAAAPTRHAEWTDEDYARGGSATQTWKQKHGRCEDAPCCGCCP